MSGKYLNPEKPVPNARFNRFKGYMERYQNEECTKACVQYAKIAEMVREIYDLGVGVVRRPAYVK